MLKIFVICAIIAATCASSVKEEEKQPVKRSSSSEVYTSVSGAQPSFKYSGKDAVVVPGAGYYQTAPAVSYGKQYYAAPYQQQAYRSYAVQQPQPYYRYNTPAQYSHQTYGYQPYQRRVSYNAYPSVPAQAATSYYSTAPRTAFADDVKYFGSPVAASPYKYEYKAPQVKYEVKTDDGYQYASFGAPSAARYQSASAYQHGAAPAVYSGYQQSAAPFSYYANSGAYPYAYDDGYRYSGYPVATKY